MSEFNLADYEDELLAALIESAKGGEYTTKKIEQAGGGEPVKHIDTKQMPPNPAIAQYLLQILDKKKYATAENDLKQQEIEIKKISLGVF